MATLSLCMICKNEEAVLGRVLGAASSFCDELIVVDTGSTDNTVELAKSYGAKVYDFAWVDDFAAARNYSFSKATGDWILWLDADDVLTSEALECFKAMKARLDTLEADVIMTPYAYGELALQRERVLRRSLNPVWQGRIHECIPTSDERIIIAPELVVTHAPTDAHEVRKEGRNLQIFKQYIDIQTASIHELNLYGSELHKAGESEEAVKAFRRYLEIYPKDKRDVFDEKYTTYVKLAEALRALGRLEESFEVAAAGILWDPSRAEAYGLFAMGQYMCGNFRAAFPLFLAAAACKPPTHGGLVFEAFYGSAIHDMILDCKQRIKEMEEVK